MVDRVDKLDSGSWMVDSGGMVDMRTLIKHQCWHQTATYLSTQSPLCMESATVSSARKSQDLWCLGRLPSSICFVLSRTPKNIEPPTPIHKTRGPTPCIKYHKRSLIRVPFVSHRKELHAGPTINAVQWSQPSTCQRAKIIENIKKSEITWSSNYYETNKQT